MGKLSSRCELVTGAAREIGRGIALAFAEEDCAVAVAAKADVQGFTRAMAWELAPHGITVNAIAPGPIETDLLRVIPADWLKRKRAEMPLGRFGRVEEISLTALLLASDGGGFYPAGATLNISGGDVML